MNINLRQVLDALSPTKPPEVILASIVVYAIGLLALIGLIMQKEGSTRDSMMLTAVMIAVLIDKIAATSILKNQMRGFEQSSFGVFLLRTLMFTFPLIVARSSQNA